MPSEKTPEIPAELVPTTVSGAPPAEVSPLPGTVSATPLPPHAAGAQPASWQWPAIHPEGLKFGGIAAAITLVTFLAGWPVIPWVLTGLTLFVLAFFRDPRRASPAGEGLILSPADGLVSQIITVELPRQLVGEGALAPGTATRISVFMSVFDVHINRAPIAGTVTRLAYVPGAFLNADLDKASEENERQYFLIEGADGTRVGFTQIAGLVARRIIGFVREGSMVGTGQRVGLIRFGSRVDVFLPEGYQPQVVKGQRAVAGETVLAARGVPAARPGPLQ
jgi:phosphatidylserine decarboxylase